MMIFFVKLGDVMVTKGPQEDTGAPLIYLCKMAEDTEVIVNELLCFMQNNFVKIGKEEVNNLICSFYTSEEVVKAKNELFTIAEGLSVNNLPRNITRKAGENKRRLDTEDTLQLYALLDVNKVALPTFVAANLSRLPAPINSTGSEISLLKLDVHELSKQMASIQSKLDSLCSVTTQLAVQPVPIAGPNPGTGARQIEKPTGFNQDSLSTEATTMLSSTVAYSMVNGTHGLSAVTPVTFPVLAADPPAEPSWAQASAALDNEAQFQTVTYKRRRQPLLVGRRIVDCNVKAVPRRITCFVGRLDNETTADDLKDYLTAAGVKGIKCVRLVAKNGRTFYSAAFRVSCDAESRDLLFDETLWPAGAELRDWIFYNHNGTG